MEYLPTSGIESMANVGKYSIHGAYGFAGKVFCSYLFVELEVGIKYQGGGYLVAGFKYQFNVHPLNIGNDRL